MVKKDYYEIRIPKDTEQHLSIMRTMNNPHEALCAYLDLLNQYHKTERSYTTHYNEKTGKPDQWEWELYERFTQVDEADGFLTKNELYAMTADKTNKYRPRPEELVLFNPNMFHYLQETLLPTCPALLTHNDRPHIIQVGSTAGGTQPRHWSHHGIIINPLEHQLTREGIQKNELPLLTLT